MDDEPRPRCEIAVIRLSDELGYRVRFSVGAQSFGIDYHPHTKEDADWMAWQLEKAFRRMGHQKPKIQHIDISQLPDTPGDE